MELSFGSSIFISYLSRRQTRKAMKEYQVDINDLPKIRALFSGYIFRRSEDGKGYIKCIDKYADFIRKNNIELNLVESN